MNDIEQKFHSAAAQVVMTPKEKVLMRQDMLFRMEEQKQNVPAQPTLSPWTAFVTRFHFQYYVVAIALILIVGGGISMAADKALPGEPLYQVKTSVNENIRALFSFTPESKAALHTELAVKRLEEAEQLAVTGKLDAATQADVESNLNGHLAVVKDSIQQLQDQNQTSVAADTNSTVESSLNAHSAILNALAQSDTTLQGVATTVQDAATSISADGATIDSEVSSTTFTTDVVEDKRTAAQSALEDVLQTLSPELPADASTTMSAEVIALTQATTTNPVVTTSAPVATSTSLLLHHVEHFAARILQKNASSTTTDALSATTTTEDVIRSLSDTIAAKIASSTNFIQLGNDKLAAGANGEAYVYFQKAERIADEIKVLLQAQQNLNVTLSSLPDEIVEGASAAVALSLEPSNLATSTATTTDMIATSTTAMTEGAALSLSGAVQGQ